jgi:hypothetical protein
MWRPHEVKFDRQAPTRFCMIAGTKGNHRMSSHLLYPGLLALVFLAGAGGPASQSAETNALAKVKSLKCVFPVYSSGSWKNGEPQVQAKTGQLSIQIDSIDVQDGSARFVGAGESSHVIAQLSGWSLHFLETGTTGSVNITTVFSQEARDKKMKAVHSRHDYLQMSLPGFVSEPTVSQYYGECETGL